MTVLITGCSSGIGLATAKHFIARGYDVVATMRTPVEIEGARVLPLDVTHDASVRDAAAAAGPVDVLVNNAGIGGGGPVELAALDRAHRTFETNYFGAVRMIQTVLPGMRERRRGRIVNVTSMAGRLTLASHSHYAASKAALESLTECLAQEVAPFGIRVAAIEPGVVPTAIFKKRQSKPDDEHNPYAMPLRRLTALFSAGLANSPTTADAVAALIEHAVTTDTPRLRYVIGRDAEALLSLRGSMTDEEWIALHATEDDGEFFRQLGVHVA